MDSSVAQLVASINQGLQIHGSAAKGDALHAHLHHCGGRGVMADAEMTSCQMLPEEVLNSPCALMLRSAREQAEMLQHQMGTAGHRFAS